MEILVQVTKIDEETNIIQPCHINAMWLNTLTWNVQEGKFGQYDSLPISDPQSRLGQLATLIQKYGNEKHYLFDLNADWKYQFHDRWINRYKKNKGELVRTAEIKYQLDNTKVEAQPEPPPQQPAKDTPEVNEAKLTAALRTESIAKDVTINGKPRRQ